MIEKELFKLTSKELIKLYGKNYNKVMSSMKAREKMFGKLGSQSGGWKFVSNTSYELWKEMKKYTPDITKDLSRNEMLHLYKLSMSILENKYYTLQATREQIKRQYEQFAERNYDTVKQLLEKEGRSDITDSMIKNRLKKISNDRDFYDFLHSEEYKKLTEKYKMESGDLQRDYILNMDNALEHYGDYLERLEEGEIEFNERELLLDNPFED